MDKRHTINVEGRFIREDIEKWARANFLRVECRCVGILKRSFDITGTTRDLSNFLDDLMSECPHMAPTIRAAIRESQR